MRSLNHKPPRLAKKTLLSFLRSDISEEVQGDLEELFYSDLEKSSLSRAKLNYWYQVLNYMRPFAIKKFKSEYSNYLTMYKHHIKIGWRNLTKQKMYSFIKIGGFALGIAACLLITLFIIDELSYDRNYPNGDRIYRVVLIYNDNGNIDKGTSFPAPFAKALKDDYPEVEKVGRLNTTEYFGAGSNEIRFADKAESTHEEGFAYADQGLLDIFQIPIINGNRAHVLDEPGTIVISKDKANKYFPNENPIGKSVIINNDASKSYRITGVMDLPVHCHFKYDFLFTTEGGFYPGEQSNWRSSSYFTYIMVSPGTDVAQLEKKFSDIIKKYIIPSERLDGNVDAEKLSERLSYKLQPVRDIYLKSEGIHDNLSHGDIRFVRLFGFIAVFILLIACINFINLSTAKSLNMAKEVGLRKTVGSNRKNLIGQFLTESLLFSFLSFALGIILAVMFLPYFNILSAKSLAIPWVTWYWVVPLLGFASVIVGILAGFYPSLYLSSFKPVSVLKGSFSRGNKSFNMRSVLVIFQFTVSIILISGTFIIHHQVEYILNKKVGFDKKQVLLLYGAKNIGDKVNTFKNELLKLTGVKNVSITDYLPITGTKRDGNGLWKEGKTKVESPVYGQFWLVDHDYIKTLGMKIVEGRDFSINMSTDSKTAIINQTLVKQLGLTNPIGKKIANFWKTYEVIGVVEDFHFESLRENIGGVCLVLGNSPSIVSVKTNTSDMAGLIQSVTQVWKAFSPNQPIRYTFLDESFATMYADVQRIGNILSTFALLAIIVACLGLFALSSFMIEQRTKEIGIRKINGAKISEMMLMLNKNITKWVITAFIIATPIAWYVMNKWLQNFAYRAEPSWWIFGLAGLLALGIALLTVSWQSWRAASRNPVEALRYE